MRERENMDIKMSCMGCGVARKKEEMRVKGCHFGPQKQKWRKEDEKTRNKRAHLEDGKKVDNVSLLGVLSRVAVREL